MSREIEVKFRIEDGKGILRKLGYAGARKVSEGFEHNECFTGGLIEEKGYLLRLRKFGDEALLTFKGPPEEGEFKEKEEIETRVSDAGRMRGILEMLGFGIFWVYEKKRTNFILGKAKVSLDRYPFATFLEIEGPSGDIKDAMEKLGLDPGQGIKKDILQLYTEYCEERGQEVENLVFWKKSG